jgi:hypothetical protein
MDDRPADHGIISIYKKHTIKTPGRVPGFFVPGSSAANNARKRPAKRLQAAA